MHDTLANIAHFEFDQLVLITVLIESFYLQPIASGGLGTAAILALLEWSSQVFAVALKIVIPAISALIVVNLSFGVMSRAAPTLNLFAVGFPVAMLLGFVVIFLNMGGAAGERLKFVRRGPGDRANFAWPLIPVAQWTN